MLSPGWGGQASAAFQTSGLQGKAWKAECIEPEKQLAVKCPEALIQSCIWPAQSWGSEQTSDPASPCLAIHVGFLGFRLSLCCVAHIRLLVSTLAMCVLSVTAQPQPPSMPTTQVLSHIKACIVLSMGKDGKYDLNLTFGPEF